MLEQQASSTAVLAVPLPFVSSSQVASPLRHVFPASKDSCPGGVFVLLRLPLVVNATIPAPGQVHQS